MLHGEAFGLLLGAVALGAVHGIEPGHGWPVAASYALDQSNKWLYGFAASFILGIGHLISSIAMVGVFFYAKSYFDLTQVNDPVAVGPIEIGGPVSIVAGVVLVALGIREYTHGHTHDHGGHSHGDDNPSHGGHAHTHTHTHGDHPHDHTHDGHDGHDGHTHAHGDGGIRTIDGSDAGGAGHSQAASDHPTHNHDSADGGILAGLQAVIPFVGGHSHGHGDIEEATDRGLWGIAWFAFLLGFAHEEEFEIIALCAGSPYCLELMGAYALTVIAGIVLLTLLLIAGYHRFEERVAAYTDYLPVFSAAVLVVMGLGFFLGLF